MAATSGMGGGMQGRFLGNSGELNPEIWDAANVRFCLAEPGVRPGVAKRTFRWCDNAGAH